MQIGPFQLEWYHLTAIAIGLVAIVWLVWSSLVRVTGTWERIDEDVKGKVERITFIQFGPLVRGRRKMDGGFQEFTGILRGRTMVLTRRDHGRKMIINQGFPDEIAEQIDGSVTAGMHLTLSADGNAIHGTFSPQKIEFTYQPPAITSRRFLEPSFRRYKRVSKQPLDSEQVDESARASRTKFRRTV